MSTLACHCCGKEFTPRNSQQKTCGSDECKKARQRAYKQTEEYKAYDRAYRQSEERKAYMRALRQTEEYKAYERARNQSRWQTDEYKAYQRAYKRAVSTAKSLGIPPLVFAAMKIMSQLQEPNHDSSQRTA